jgi:hypothetical protein
MLAALVWALVLLYAGVPPVLADKGEPGVPSSGLLAS